MKNFFFVLICFVPSILISQTLSRKLFLEEEARMKAGIQTSEEYFIDEHKRKVTRYFYVYNKNGKVVEEYFYTQRNVFRTFYYYSGGDGSILRALTSVKVLPDTIFKTTSEVIYNKGQVWSSSSISDTTRTLSVRYYYDERNNLISTFEPSLGVTKIYHNTYSADGKLQSVFFQDSSAGFTEKNSYTYYPDGTIKTEKKELSYNNGESSGLEITQFNKKGIPVKKEWKSFNNMNFPINGIITTYDKHGNVSKEFDFRKPRKAITGFRYKYDKFGNIYSKKQTLGSGNSVYYYSYTKF